MVETKQEIRAALESARARTEELLAPLSDDELAAELAPDQPPLVWDYAGIAYFEELWLLRNLDAQLPAAERHDEFYGSFRVDGTVRQLPPLRPAAARAYAADVRERALEALEKADLDGSPLLRKGFVFGLVLQHELQHQETMLEQLEAWGGDYPLPHAPAPDSAPAGPAEIRIPEGSFVLGAVSEPWALDNELVPHEVEVRPFWIERTPVTNASFADFVEDGGYRSESLWTSEGWEWLQGSDVAAPLYWERTGDAWELPRFGRRGPPPRDEPVQHVSWYEADAYARWMGKRLPTETEWERAAGWDERLGKSRYPWGTAASHPLPQGPTPVGRARAGACRWRATYGSGPRRSSIPTRGSSRSPIPSTRRPSSARSRVSCGAGPGRPTLSSRARASAGGRARTGGSCSPAFAAPATTRSAWRNWRPRRGLPKSAPRSGGLGRRAAP